MNAVAQLLFSVKQTFLFIETVIIIIIIIIILTLRVTEANIANQSPANSFRGVDLNLKLFALSPICFCFDGSGNVFRKIKKKINVILYRPDGNIFDPQLPGVTGDVHVGREPLVVGVAADTVGQQVDVSVPQPGDRPVAQVGDGAHHPDVLPHYGPHHTLTLTWGQTFNNRQIQIQGPLLSPPPPLSSKSH